MFKKTGYTMAEVLITLGIIGAVSAITLPTVVKNYRKHIVESRLKHAYSVLSQALEKSKAEYGDFSKWDSLYGQSISGSQANMSKIFFDKYILPNLKTSSIPKILRLDNLGYKKGLIYLNGSNYVNYKYYFYSVKLTNGTLLMFSYQYNGNTHVINGNPLVWIDIDGSKGYNVIGKDQFLFEIDNKITPYLYPKNISNFDRSNYNSKCGLTESAILIMHDGWKISEDNPCWQ